MAGDLKELRKKLHIIFDSNDVNIDEVKDLMRNTPISRKEWSKYAHFSPYKYTRNLVDSGNGKFNLMILCWGEGHGSSIHSHANSHCFMKIIQGSVKETKFAWPENCVKKNDGKCVDISEEEEDNHDMEVIGECVLKNGEVCYISDDIGLHRVENVSHTEPAASLHLYSPPFSECYCFDQRSGHKTTAPVTFWSKFGNVSRSNEMTTCSTIKE